MNGSNKMIINHFNGKSNRDILSTAKQDNSTAGYRGMMYKYDGVTISISRYASMDRDILINNYVKDAPAFVKLYRTLEQLIFRSIINSKYWGSEADNTPQPPTMEELNTYGKEGMTIEYTDDEDGWYDITTSNMFLIRYRPSDYHNFNKFINGGTIYVYVGFENGNFGGPENTYWWAEW